MIYWTANFKKFRKKVESAFGDIKLLAKNNPDIYTHQVLSHGFMEYSFTKELKATKEEYLKWAKENKLCEELLEEGWKEYKND